MSALRLATSRLTSSGDTESGDKRNVMTLNFVRPPRGMNRWGWPLFPSYVMSIVLQIKFGFTQFFLFPYGT